MSEHNDNRHLSVHLYADADIDIFNSRDRLIHNGADKLDAARHVIDRLTEYVSSNDPANYIDEPDVRTLIDNYVIELARARISWTKFIPQSLYAAHAALVAATGAP